MVVQNLWNRCFENSQKKRKNGKIISGVGKNVNPKAKPIVLTSNACEDGLSSSDGDIQNKNSMYDEVSELLGIS